MQQGNYNHEQGFSLLELLIYLAILSVVSLAMIGVFLSINRGRGQVESRAAVAGNLRFAFEKIGQDIRSASAISYPSTTASASSSLEVTVGGSRIQYCIVAGVLRRQPSGSCTGSSEAMTESGVSVSVPRFTRFENTNSLLNKTTVSIEVSLTATYNSSSPDYQYSETKKTTIAPLR